MSGGDQNVVTSSLGSGSGRYHCNNAGNLLENWLQVEKLSDSNVQEWENVSIVHNLVLHF